MGKEHFVKQGECLSSLAKRFGFVDYLTIYEHPNNSELKKKRPNPNVLYPNDVVFIPDNELKEVEGATEQKHRFQLIRNKTLFRLIVKDGDEQPFANVRYELKHSAKSINVYFVNKIVVTTVNKGQAATGFTLPPR